MRRLSTDPGLSTHHRENAFPIAYKKSWARGKTIPSINGFVWNVFSIRASRSFPTYTPNWLPSENKFKCPFHGSGFYKTGINFEGPAPRPLERYAIALSDDGQIVVDKSRKYQYEKGQWSDPESILQA